MSHHYIRFQDVTYRYPDGYEALHGISFVATHGQKVAVLGLNGAGKSTMLLHTNGLLMPTSGTVNVGDVPLTPKTLDIVRRTVGMVFQNSDDQLFMPTVAEDVAFGPLNMRLPADEVRRRVTEALRRVGADGLAARRPGTLSGGQKRAVAIATVLAMEPSILVMDEPTAELDLRARQNLIMLLKSLTHTCLIATHDLEMALEVCERALLISDGRIVADGPTSEVVARLCSEYCVE